MTVELHADIRFEDGMYWAQVRELPGCFASGVNVAELTEAVEEAVGMCLDRRGDGTTAQLTGMDFATTPTV